jgi:5-methyltetrahydropteroyltriglutamate--homocysteine methyltransferase
MAGRERFGCSTDDAPTQGAGSRFAPAAFSLPMRPPVAMLHPVSTEAVTPRTPARAEVVGSLLRPADLRAAIEATYGPGHRAMQADERAKDLTELHRLEDGAIAEAVRRQIDTGLDVVTDGEFRRYMFLNSFWDAVEGFSTDRNPVEFRNEQGAAATWHVQRIEERLRVVDSPAAREAAFLRETTGGFPFKVTFPAASLFTHPFTFRPHDAYADTDELVDHCIRIERSLIADAVAAGARSIQLDFPVYPYLVDPRWSARFRDAGFDPGSLLTDALAADRAVVDGLPDDITVSLHVCRGNYRSRWLCEGSLEPVAERLFGELDRYDRFLVEWDDTRRDGTYEPVRFVRPGAVMVMGVVSSKSREIEPFDEILRRMEAAAMYLPYEQLAVSTQCGFASVMEGNEIDDDVQWRKLELVARVADRLWR